MSDTRLDKNLASLPVQEGARLLALSLLRVAAEARARLSSADDAEALHDLRVGLRRLRSCIKAYQRELDLPKKQRARLRYLSRATGAGRDSEVQLAWLAGVTDLLPRQRAGLDWLVTRLQQKREKGYAQVMKEVAPDFDKLETALTSRLRTYEADLLGGEQQSLSMGELAAKSLLALRAKVEEVMSKIISPRDEKHAHAMRILVKQLRYLLEPFRGEVDVVKRFVAALKSLQELLGDLNDACVLATELGEAMEAAAAERAKKQHDLIVDGEIDVNRHPDVRRDPRPGLLALARVVSQRRDQLFAQLADQWLAGQAAELLAQLDDVSAALTRQGARRNRRLRRLLLTRLPSLPDGTIPVEVEESWLDGPRIVEGLRRVRAGDKETLHRLVRVFQRNRSATIEQVASAAIFHALWPLSQDRVRYVRYAIGEGDTAMAIRSYADRNVVIAETVLSELPPFIATEVMADITEDPAYDFVR